MNEVAIHTIVAGEEDAGDRLDRMLARQLDTLSRARIQALFRAGFVKIDGLPAANLSGKVKPGQRIVVEVPPPVDATPRAQEIPLTVVHEDEHLIVIDKPAGLVVHPAPGHPDRTLVNALIAHCGDSLLGIGGERRPGIVHRLDRDTSGLMVAAKTDVAHAGLVQQFARHSIERAYTAIVWGSPGASEGRVEGPIGRSRYHRKKMSVVNSGGRYAATLWRVEQRFGTLATEVTCRLETGRTHQVRVHMTHIGHSLVGDPLYGRPPRGLNRSDDTIMRVTTFPRQALHARVLGFDHPVSGAALCFEADAPSDIINLRADINRIAKLDRFDTL